MAISVNVDSNEDILDLLKLIDISGENVDPDVMEINFNKVMVTFGRVQKSLLVLQKEITELQNSSSGSGGTSGGTSSVSKKFLLNFVEGDWKESSGNFILKILPSQHHLGTDVTLASILKGSTDGFEDAFVTFKVYVDGTVIVTSELVFSGKLTIDQMS